MTSKLKKALIGAAAAAVGAATGGTAKVEDSDKAVARKERQEAYQDHVKTRCYRRDKE